MLPRMQAKLTMAQYGISPWCARWMAQEPHNCVRLDCISSAMERILAAGMPVIFAAHSGVLGDVPSLPSRWARYLSKPTVYLSMKAWLCLFWLMRW